jgi:hypothetical protein
VTPVAVGDPAKERNLVASCVSSASAAESERAASTCQVRKTTAVSASASTPSIQPMMRHRALTTGRLSPTTR